MNPIGIGALDWKFYIVYMIILVLECLANRFLYVKTRGPTLEVIAILFDGENANIAGTNVVFGADGEMKSAKGATAERKQLARRCA